MLSFASPLAYPEKTRVLRAQRNHINPGFCPKAKGPIIFLPISLYTLVIAFQITVFCSYLVDRWAFILSITNGNRAQSRILMLLKLIATPFVVINHNKGHDRSIVKWMFLLCHVNFIHHCLFENEPTILFFIVLLVLFNQKMFAIFSAVFIIY